MDQAVLGMDPHKRTVTVEAMTGSETALGGGRYATTREGYRAILAWARHFADPRLGGRGLRGA
jgi:hypothetical protein